MELFASNAWRIATLRAYVVLGGIKEQGKLRVLCLREDVEHGATLPYRTSRCVAGKQDLEGTYIRFENWTIATTLNKHHVIAKACIQLVIRKITNRVTYLNKL